MAEAILSQISGDFLECTICLEPFKDPKILPCLHTFCEGCLKKFVAQQGDVKDKFPCPTCRNDTVLPEGSVSGLKNNFFVQSLSDTVQAHKSLVSKEDDKVQCDNCEEEGAGHGCVVCEEFLCNECASAHHRGKRTRSHEVIGTAELKEQLITTGLLKSKSLPICPKHEDEKMKFYCETCKCPICRDCWVLQHKDHKYGYLADAVGNVRAEIKEKLDAAGQKITEYQNKASAVAKKQAELDTRSKKAIEDIDAAAEEEMEHFSDLVTSKQTKLKDELAAITAARSKQLSAAADSVESTLGCLTSTVQFSQKVVEHGSDFDVMNVYADVTARLESLLTCPTPDIPDGISYVMFDPKTERKEKGVILGNIVDEDIQDDEKGGESRAEATFRFTVDNFSKLSDDKFSPPVFIRNLPWKICVKPYCMYIPNAQLPTQKNFAVFLQCEADSKSLWSCHALVELRLIPQMKGVQTFMQKVEQTFYNNGSSWEIKELMPWHEVCDPQKGYIKDDKIILEAYVKADPPCGEKEISVDNIDGKEKEEEPESEATIRFTMENFSKVTKTRNFSRAVFIQNLPWKILAMPSVDSNAQPSNKNLAVFLHCEAESNSLWSCRASAELRLIPQKEGVQPLTHDMDQIFYNKDRSWGTTHFMPWHEVCDPQKGYIKDDKILLKAYVKADAPRGMKEITLGNIFSEEKQEKIESQPEATIPFTMENFSEVNKMQYSNPVFIRNLPWKIMARPDYSNSSDPSHNKSLAVFLKCDANSNSFWSCRAWVEFRLIPQWEGVQIHRREFKNVFYKNAINWGYSNFMPWHEVCDPQKGYIKDNKIILAAYVKADAPCILA